MLEKLGLHRPELRAWALYDWANSAFVTVVVTAVFPIFFLKVASRGVPQPDAVVRFATATTIAMGLAAVTCPFLGAWADSAGIRKRLLGLFMALGVASTAALALIGPGAWQPALALFMLANFAASAGFVFYDALLPHLARPAEIDRVSTAGYALGYFGGGLVLAFSLWLLRTGRPPGWIFPVVAGWWLLFSLPLLRSVPEPPGEAGRPGVLSRLAGTLRELRRYRQAWIMMLAFMLYNDGIGTIIRLATTFGAEVGLGEETLVGAILVAQGVGIPCTFLFGAIAGRIGPKRAILACLGVYVLVTAVAYGLRTARDFYLLAGMVGVVQGGSQALSRSLFASLIPEARTAEFFAFFGVLEKFAGLLGPALIAFLVHLTGSTRHSLPAVNLFFLAGGLLLCLVRVEEGRRAAREG